MPSICHILIPEPTQKFEISLTCSSTEPDSVSGVSSPLSHCCPQHRECVQAGAACKFPQSTLPVPMAAVLHTTECLQSAMAMGSLQDPELACASTQKQQPPPEQRGCLLRKDFCLVKIHKLVSAHGIKPNYLILPLLLSYLLLLLWFVHFE